MFAPFAMKNSLRDQCVYATWFGSQAKSSQLDM